jgi:hypothetical protein
LVADHLSLIRDHLAPLLHPESLWSYLWTDADTQRVSDVLDEAYRYDVGSGLWTIDWMGHGPLFTFGADEPCNAVVYGKAWVLAVRPFGSRERGGDTTVRVVWVAPKTKPKVWSPASARFVTLKAWREASEKAQEAKWPRLMAGAEADLRARFPELFPEVAHG